jgi:hypothetical protein
MNAATLVAKPLASNTQISSVLKQDKNPLTSKHHQGQERLLSGAMAKRGMIIFLVTSITQLVSCQNPLVKLVC